MKHSKRKTSLLLTRAIIYSLLPSQQKTNTVTKLLFHSCTRTKKTSRIQKMYSNSSHFTSCFRYWAARTRQRDHVAWPSVPPCSVAICPAVQRGHLSRRTPCSTSTASTYLTHQLTPASSPSLTVTHTNISTQLGLPYLLGMLSSASRRPPKASITQDCGPWRPCYSQDKELKATRTCKDTEDSYNSWLRNILSSSVNM